MGHERDIAWLRSRITALVQEEGLLLNEAFERSRGEDRRGVDALFARIQAMQVERNTLKKEIANVLGTQRMHVAAEVWRPGVYEYRRELGEETVRVRIEQGPLGLQVLVPGERGPVPIETLEGSFHGPLAVDDAPAQQEAPKRRRGSR